MIYNKKKVNHDPELIKKLIDDCFKKYRIDNSLKFNIILDNWEKIVGSKIAEKAEPVDIKNKILFLSVKNSIWRNQIFFLKKDIINQINSFVNQNIVENIFFNPIT